MVVKKGVKVDKNHLENMAIVALILNVIILPGLGSLIGGKTREGIWQLVLYIGGFLLGLLLILSVVGVFVGIPVLIIAPIVAWVWGLMTGIKLIKESK
jgi:hypothetical protein